MRFKGSRREPLIFYILRQYYKLGHKLNVSKKNFLLVLYFSFYRVPPITLCEKFASEYGRF